MRACSRCAEGSPSSPGSCLWPPRCSPSARYYLPRDDVNFAALSPSSNHSLCPYKGVADEYWNVTGQPEGTNAAWSYSNPFPAVEKVKGRVAFYNELVDITVDGIAQERPVSVFSSQANRPVS